jgi:MFS family permease
MIGSGLLAGVAYLLHARSHPAPVIDVSLLRLTSLRLSIAGGSLMRITQGAQPFLIALMLQVGFGLAAATSGAIASAGALGAVLMKGLAPRILLRFGFRRTLVVSGVLAVAGYALCGFIRPDWPTPLILTVLTFASFFMSLLFTGYNTIAYAEVPSAKMSAATGFYSTMQQLLLSLGVCVGAIALHVSMTLAGRESLALLDFRHAFLAVTTISAFAILVNLRFAPEAGRDLVGG